MRSLLAVSSTWPYIGFKIKITIEMMAVHPFIFALFSGLLGAGFEATAVV